MSNWRFLERLRALDQALGGGAPSDAARVQIVADNRYLTSRERAPYAADWSISAVPAAGTHFGFRLFGTDAAAANCWSLVNFLKLDSTGSSGYVVGVSATAPTFATGPTARTPVIRENDRDLTPRIETFTVATANLPVSGSNGYLNESGTFWAIDASQGAPWLPLMSFLSPERHFYVISLDAAAAVAWRTQWQAVRE